MQSWPHVVGAGVASRPKSWLARYSMCEAVSSAIYPVDTLKCTSSQVPCESGDQDELAADMTALTDAVRLGGALERERLHLDHQLVLGQ